MRFRISLVRDLLKLLPNVTVTEHGQILVQGNR